MGEHDRIDALAVYLQPISWKQSIGTNANADSGSEERKLSAECIAQDYDLKLVTGKRVEGMHVEVYVSAATKPRQPLLGALRFLDSGPYSSEGNPEGAFLAVSLSIGPLLMADVWEQVLRGEYTECSLSLEVAPIEEDGGEYLWDVKEHPRLNIEAAEFSFTRKAP